MTVGSLFAGIGGFDLGFERSGFQVRWQVEQDAKAVLVLRHRFPRAVIYDDVRTVGAANLEPVDVICGGFPCQDVSVAGRRTGLGGARTGLFWEVVRIARELQPRWMVLENVPGLLSSHGGRDFHAVLSALAELGFRRAYRILDSRYFGVAQRRRRVFIVLRAGRGGDGADAVLFEPPSGHGDSAAGDEARADVAVTLRGRSHGAGVNPPGRGGEDDQNLVYALRSNERNTSQGPGNYISFDNRDAKSQDFAGTIRSDCHGANPMIAATLNSGGNAGGFRTEPGEHLVIPERAGALVGSMHKRHDDDTDTLIPTLSASLGHHGHSSPRGDGHDPIVAFALRSDPGGTGQGHNTTYPGGVRRLTPLECERLQGFPDGWTCLCGEGHRGSRFCACADSPRYKQLGNAVTVNVAQWIAEQILKAEQA